MSDYISSGTVVSDGGTGIIPAPDAKAMPDVWSAAVEKWIETEVIGTDLETMIPDLRHHLPSLYFILIEKMFSNE